LLLRTDGAAGLFAGDKINKIKRTFFGDQVPTEMDLDVFIHTIKRCHVFAAARLRPPFGAGVLAP
jgi:hypothetical protein